MAEPQANRNLGALNPEREGSRLLTRNTCAPVVKSTFHELRDWMWSTCHYIFSDAKMEFLWGVEVMHIISFCTGQPYEESLLRGLKQEEC